MTSKEFAKALRTHLKKTAPRLAKISVTIGKGTARSWVSIRGSLEFGYFTQGEKTALVEMGMPRIVYGLNGAAIASNGIYLDYQDQAYMINKLGL